MEPYDLKDKTRNTVINNHLIIFQILIYICPQRWKCDRSQLRKHGGHNGNMLPRWTLLVISERLVISHMICGHLSRAIMRECQWL